MDDKIVGLQARVIEQVGRPLALHPNPHNSFAAGFIGSPEMNVVEGVRYLGEDTFIHIHGVRGCQPMTMRSPAGVAETHGDTDHLTPNASHIHKSSADGLRMS